jgi:ribulose-5-phosphate 4-epimerase/fuculose-1-phosphate aldolase
MKDIESKKAFVTISHYAGMREDLVQAGGGNTSVKLDNGVMRVKSSGVLLSEVTDECGFADVDYQQIANAVVCGEQAANDALKSFHIRGGKPSIETFLHALTPGKFTLHTHPLAYCMLACRTEGMNTLAELFPDAAYIGYAKPGYPLAVLFNGTVRNSKTSPKLIFLQNHGIVVSGDTVDEITGDTEASLKKIEDYLEISMDNYRAATDIYELLHKAVGFSGIVCCCRDKALVELKGEPFDFAYCPDCVVYCGKGILYLETFSVTTVKEFSKRSGNPAVISFNGQYYVAADTMRKAREIESLLSFAARIYANGRENGITLSEAERDFLLSWDAEKYRQSLK